MSILEIIIKYHEGLIQGLQVTFQLCLIVWLSGMLIGTLLGLLSSRSNVLMDNIIKGFSFILSGVPLFVFLFWVHYPLQQLLQITIDPFFTTVLTLSIVNIFSVCDIVRNAIKDIPRQFIEVADVCGITNNIKFLKIELPLIFRHAISPFIIVQVNMLHMTLFASLISVGEIFRVAQRINSIIYKPVEIYTALGLFFLIISLPLNGLAIYLKNKYARDFSEK